MIFGKLYQYAACPFCRKVRAALRFKGMEFEAVEVHPLNKKELAFSTYKKVPIFVDYNGKQINDSSVILKHLDSLVQAPLLFSTESQKAEREQKWMHWADNKLVRALSPVIYQTLPMAWQSFGYVSRVCGFSAWQKVWIRLVGACVMWRVAAQKAKQQSITNPVEHLNQLLDELAGAVSQGFLSGDSMPSCADISVWGYLDCLKELEAWKYVENNPQVLAWVKRVESHFSF